MHPIIIEFMIKERIKDLTAELENARMAALAHKKAEPKKKIKGGAGIRIGIRFLRFLSGKH